MTKKELQERIVELETREIVLEAIAQSMYNVFEQVANHPIVGTVLGHTNVESLMRSLYNTAEVRSDIDDLVDITAITE